MDIRKKQRAVVDALEDVKGRDIVVFNVARLSPFFERVVIASGDSTRQVKALADHVQDKLRALGAHGPTGTGRFRHETRKSCAAPGNPAPAARSREE